MPSTMLGASGPQQIISGNPWSGQSPLVVGGIQLSWDINASGRCFIGFSGNMTFNSGGPFLSGTLGINDGMPLPAGYAFFVPKYKLMPGILSGNFNIFAHVDPEASGTLLSWERF